jgi:uncharacterized iron-regulated protein
MRCFAGWAFATFCLCLGACALHAGTARRDISTDMNGQFWASVEKADVIYVGETHDNPADHQYEKELVRELLKRGMRFAIGWEMFDETQQSAIDAWTSHSISLKEMLAKTRFQQDWGVYSAVYERILQIAGDARVPNIALNAAPDLVQKIARGTPLSAGEQAMLPNGFVSNEYAYNNFLTMMGGHPGMSEADRRRFFAAQNIWDQTMASRVLEFKRGNPGLKLVVLTGRGHVSGGFGIPFYVKQKSDLRQMVLLPKGLGVRSYRSSRRRRMQNRSAAAKWRSAPYLFPMEIIERAEIRGPFCNS